MPLSAALPQGCSASAAVGPAAPSSATATAAKMNCLRMSWILLSGSKFHSEGAIDESAERRERRHIRVIVEERPWRERRHTIGEVIHPDGKCQLRAFMQAVELPIIGRTRVPRRVRSHADGWRGSAVDAGIDCRGDVGIAECEL